MRWSDIPRNPPDRTLRQFAAIGCVVFAALAAWSGLVRHREALAALHAAIAAVLAVSGLLVPRGLRPVFVGMMMLTYPLNWLVSHLLLAVLFYCLFTPLALFFRLIGRDVLGLGPGGGQASFWAEKVPPAGTESYFRQS